MSATETVTLPLALADSVSRALNTASDMTLAVDFIAKQQPQDEVMAGALYALQAIVNQLDRDLQGLPHEFADAVKAAREVSRG